MILRQFDVAGATFALSCLGAAPWTGPWIATFASPLAPGVIPLNSVLWALDWPLFSFVMHSHLAHHLALVLATILHSQIQSGAALVQLHLCLIMCR